MSGNVQLVYQHTTIRPVFGGMKVVANYIMTHAVNGCVNRYAIECEIIGIADADPRLSVYGAEFIGDRETDTNQETLTESGASDLFESQYI